MSERAVVERCEPYTEQVLRNELLPYRRTPEEINCSSLATRPSTAKHAHFGRFRGESGRTLGRSRQRVNSYERSTTISTTMAVSDTNGRGN
ncbi:hypothetical protein HSB1_34930 [Halogranum salarium B-1]|uniref:Uncharacterized protein n=1 Tax=Halogranum salarium B-1 TaxID=1210908 RepID=J3JE56_9EURY|nr:hypothetical protein HSB1_34930 [Halogranum salarium B-1]